MENRLQRATNRLADILISRSSEKVVFAESCTAGLVASALGGLPGISSYLCGSLVTYRESAKQTFLSIPPEVLAECSAVSTEVTEQMAVNVLDRMEEATWSAAVTGHLGPGAPEPLDGTVFVAIAERGQTVELRSCLKFQLQQSDRLTRQGEAAYHVLQSLSDAIEAD